MGMAGVDTQLESHKAARAWPAQCLSNACELARTNSNLDITRYLVFSREGPCRFMQLPHGGYIQDAECDMDKVEEA